MQTVFGLWKNIQLPFSTPNQPLPDKEIFNKAFIKPSKFKLNQEIISLLNIHIPEAEFKYNYEFTKKDMKFHISGYVSKIKCDDKPYYKACPVLNCRRKMLDTSKGFECRKCMKYYDNYVPAYSLQACIADFSDQIQINFYRCHGQALLGIPAETFMKIKETSRHNEVQEIYNKTLYKHIVLEIQGSYSGPCIENKLSFVCNRIYLEEQWNAFNKYLLWKLREYKLLNQKEVKSNIEDRMTDNDLDYYNYENRDDIDMESDDLVEKVDINDLIY